MIRMRSMRRDQAMGTNRAPNVLNAASRGLGGGFRPRNDVAPSSRAWRTRPRQMAAIHTTRRHDGSARNKPRPSIVCGGPTARATRSNSSRSDPSNLSRRLRLSGPRRALARRLGEGFGIPDQPWTHGAPKSFPFFRKSEKSDGTGGQISLLQVSRVNSNISGAQIMEGMIP